MFKTYALAAALALTASASQAVTVVNGSFEDPSTNPWNIYPNIPGWIGGTGGIEIQPNGTLGVSTPFGTQYVELDTTSNSSMTQSISLTAGRYELSFWYSPRPGVASGSNEIDYSIAGFSGSVSGSVAGWTEVVLEFIVSSTASYDLTFAADGASDSLGGLIDNVSIAAVPVPAGGLLLLGALGGLAALRRRKTV